MVEKKLNEVREETEEQAVQVEKAEVTAKEENETREERNG